MRTEPRDLNRADMCNGAEVTPQLTWRLKNEIILDIVLFHVLMV